MTSNDQPPAAAATPPPVQLGVATTPESPARTRRRDSAWKRMVAGMRPQLKASQFLAGILCAVLGFALVVQVRASASDQLAGLRQEDLVRLLDDVTTRADQLETEASRLQQIRDELATST
ncbi:MAG: hypothetical protein LBB54_06605, partial [Cellulomonadaceae bacterium]|nr:hypothetical protein [Cellulomonadaceae bacterium]